MEWADNNMTFVHITGKNNVFVDAFSWIKTLDIYKEPLEKPKKLVVSNTQEYVMEIHSTNMHTGSTTMLCTE